MESKIWAIINWSVLVVVTFVAVWMILGVPQISENNGDGEIVSVGSCVDVAELEGFKYEACYDAASEMIFLKANREKANYHINKLTVSFVDLSSQSYDLKDVPVAGGKGAYKILAKKNPKNINIGLGVVRDFVEPVCEDRSVFVDYCPVGIAGNGVDVSISPIDGVGIKDFVEVKSLPELESDVIAMDLAEKEKIWESTCKSNWDCGRWEACEEGVQRRDCNDSNHCIIPTSSPIRAQRCDGSCIENWECEWGSCENGWSFPSCNDLSGCGTNYEIPDKLACEERDDKCVPNVVCGDWSACEVDYNFVDLVGVSGLAQLSGSKSRICADKKGCISTQREDQVCSISVDVYTKRFKRCGEDYIGVYNILEDSTLAVLKEGNENKAYLNIYFDDQDGVYCDYCFDGKMNGDEEDVDCGGSCRKCEADTFVERSWWDYIFR